MELMSSQAFEDPSTIEEIPEDDDDEGFVSFDSSKIPVYTVMLEETTREKCKTIIICEGIEATDFAKSHLPLVGSEPIGKLVKKTQLDKSEVEIWGFQYKEPEPSWFFQINEETLLCTCNPTISSEDFSLFAKTVITSFNSTMAVVILTVSPITNYKSDDHTTSTEAPLIRTLATSAFNSNGFVKNIRLEQPNILGGLAAGFLTVCDIKQIPAVACVAFSSNLDADVVNGFTTFLHSVECTQQLQISPTKRFPVRDKCTKTGNLYI
ncbi:proteasome assembly chaperone 1-like [Daphnia carinata]|uniref:proteasome assembly chaperone 1-like n=1 Tax=Daphnia carinata TaxID=120202 RepID=UPI00257A78B9|nr:proteasome assembly chaperone 1-like [Daphnia carinata]